MTPIEQIKAGLESDTPSRVAWRSLLETALFEIERLNKWADGFSDAQLKERRLCEERVREMEMALKSADEAINPPDRGGISLDSWNQRLKAATALIRSVLPTAKPSRGEQ
jgi:hypothetical protein